MAGSGGNLAVASRRLTQSVDGEFPADAAVSTEEGKVNAQTVVSPVIMELL